MWARKTPVFCADGLCGRLVAVPMNDGTPRVYLVSVSVPGFIRHKLTLSTHSSRNTGHKQTSWHYDVSRRIKASLRHTQWQRELMWYEFMRLNFKLMVWTLIQSFAPWIKKYCPMVEHVQFDKSSQSVSAGAGWSRQIKTQSKRAIVDRK